METDCTMSVTGSLENFKPQQSSPNISVRRSGECYLESNCTYTDKRDSCCYSQFSPPWHGAYFTKTISKHLSALQGTQTGTSEDGFYDKKADLIKDGTLEPLSNASSLLCCLLFHQEVHSHHQVVRPTVRLIITMWAECKPLTTVHSRFDHQL